MEKCGEWLDDLEKKDPSGYASLLSQIQTEMKDPNDMESFASAVQTKMHNQNNPNMNNHSNNHSNEQNLLPPKIESVNESTSISNIFINICIIGTH